MNDYLKNPELDRLVEELNRERDTADSDPVAVDEGESERRRAERPMQTEPGPGSPLETVLREMSRRGATSFRRRSRARFAISSHSAFTQLRVSSSFLAHKAAAASLPWS